MDFSKRIFIDGGMGTMLHKKGYRGDTALANIDAPGLVADIHREYAAAGADVITANTFSAYGHKFDNFEAMIRAAVAAARAAGKLVALDMGPTGLLLEPYGDTPASECAAIFEASAKAGAACCADLIIIETMMDLAEMELAVKAAKSTGLPVFATMSFTEKGRTMYGTSIAAMVESLTAHGVDAIGMNCGFGPESYIALAKELASLTTLPTILQPNAGLPEISGGITTYNVAPQSFAATMKEIALAGIGILGGCCGTEPAHIQAMRQACEGIGL
ncbi:MAG: homocysteine S-methyltransferase family protein [Defluviitaleaceae bacterium]|nr:homocysteine S-methyltransferase family protein [Defluviitaleaceae bacterium]